jgi:hypothetical protein
MKEWREARNQEELDALIEQHGSRLCARLRGTWNDVRLDGRALHSLDMSGACIRGAVCVAMARIAGNLDARAAQIGETLHAYRTCVGGDLLLVGARIERDAHIVAASVGASINAGCADIGGALLMNWTHVNGSVTIARARICGSVICNRAHIGGRLNAARAWLGGSLTCRAYIRDGIDMPEMMHGVTGRAIAEHDGYMLWRGDDGLYRAGCRGPFTRAQALAHWDRQDKRARVFSAAIARENSVQRDGERSA